MYLAAGPSCERCLHVVCWAGQGFLVSMQVLLLAPDPVLRAPANLRAGAAPDGPEPCAHWIRSLPTPPWCTYAPHPGLMATHHVFPRRAETKQVGPDGRTLRRSLNQTGRYVRQPTNDPASQVRWTLQKRGGVTCPSLSLTCRFQLVGGGQRAVGSMSLPRVSHQHSSRVTGLGLGQAEAART